MSYVQQRNDLASRFKPLPDGSPDYARAEHALALNGIKPDSKSVQARGGKTPRAITAQPVTRNHSEQQSIKIEILGEPLSANRIWRSIITPRRKIALIGMELAGKPLIFLIGNLFKIVCKHFMPTVVLTDDAKKWKANVASIAARTPIAPAKTYSVKLEFYGHFLTRDNRVYKRDLDNCTKLTLDAISDGLGIDDSQFFRLEQSKYNDLENPRIVAVISVLEPMAERNL
jgi:Holliday junction resolvase RusA-like endonuclease